MSNQPEASLRESLARLERAPLSSVLAKLGNFLGRGGIQAYIVGGLVRDILLGQETADIDLTVAGDALDAARRAAAALGGSYVLLDDQNRIARVVLPDQSAPSVRKQWEVDFSTLEDSIDDDLARRDFTINAMAIDLAGFLRGPDFTRLIDPMGGWHDLHHGRLRAVSETIFVADAARLLRAVRLSAELGFTIDETTETLIQGDARLIAGIAGERVRDELLGMLATSRAGQSLFLLDRLDLLPAIFPELDAARGVEQPIEHFWDVFEHSLRTVMALDFLLRQGTWDYEGEAVLSVVPWSETLARHFTGEVSGGGSRRAIVKLAALFHDIGKPQTKTTEPGGRARFLGHAQTGAAIATAILQRLRFSGKEIKLVETEILHHLRPTQMTQPDSTAPTRRAMYRYFRDTGDAGIDILFLSLADHLATRGPNINLTYWREHAQVVEYVLSQQFTQKDIVSPSRLLDGHDLISIFALSPGPKIGELLEAVREAQAAGELTTREEAVEYIRQLLTSAQ
ncbi:MAG: HD domain-containing protein [Chloroflexi bacterium]|nr:HD domain-containing protein [Chloroflexota bacterium]